MWCLFKKLSMAVMVLVGSGSWIVPLVTAADFFVDNVQTLCISEFNVLLNNPALIAATTYYDCSFTGGTCQVDFTGKQDNVNTVCRDIGGIPYQVDIVLDCTDAITSITTGLSLTNAVYCHGKSCTASEVNEVSGEYAAYDLGQNGQVCTGVASGATPAVLGAKSAAFRAHNGMARPTIQMMCLSSLLMVGPLFW
jgi:hypothetical protein